jgi:hypothetical protein
MTYITSKKLTEEASGQSVVEFGVAKESVLIVSIDGQEFVVK